MACRTTVEETLSTCRLVTLQQQQHNVPLTIELCEECIAALLELDLSQAPTLVGDAPYNSYWECFTIKSDYDNATARLKFDKDVNRPTPFQSF